MSDFENNRYIKTGQESGYIPGQYVLDDENDYIITAQDEREESSGELKSSRRRVAVQKHFKK